MIVALQVVLCPNGTDEGFTFFDPARLCLDVVSLIRSDGGEHKALNYLFFRFETTMFIHSFHVGFSDANQLVLEILEVTRFRPSLLLSFRDVFVKVIQSLYDLLIGTCNDERLA